MWNLAHRNGMLATAQAACWLVLAGFALREKKKEIGHGRWLKWVAANCEYSERAMNNYMGLAEGIAARAKKKGAALGDMRAEDFHALLEKSAGTLDEAEQLRLLKAVHGLTGEETIKQLYLDFGIIKPAHRPGGKTYERDGVKGARQNLTPAQATEFLRGQCVELSSLATFVAKDLSFVALTKDTELTALEHNLRLALDAVAAWRKLTATERSRALTARLGEMLAE